VVRLAEVAQQAGVSISTASRALNRPALVSPPVVDRVQAVARSLGYAPNPFARSLRLQASRTLGLLIPDNTNPFFAEVARGIEAACFRAGYTLILCNSDRSIEKEAAQARVLVEKRVDGVLFFNTSDASLATIRWLHDRGLPVVLLERRLPAGAAAGGPAGDLLRDAGSAGGEAPAVAVDCVLSDNIAGMRAAVEHLAQLGHRRVACLAGDLGAAHYAERVAAFRDAMQAVGLEAAPALIWSGLVTYADGQRTAAELLRRPDRPTALICTTDTLAIGALRGAAQLGLTVPGDVSVIGYGNTEVTAYTHPPLTCVAQDKLAVGALGVRVLLRRLQARAQARRAHAPPAPRPQVHIIPTRLVVRESTGAPPTDELGRVHGSGAGTPQVTGTAAWP